MNKDSRDNAKPTLEEVLEDVFERQENFDLALDLLRHECNLAFQRQQQQLQWAEELHRGFDQPTLQRAILRLEYYQELWQRVKAERDRYVPDRPYTYIHPTTRDDISR